MYFKREKFSSPANDAPDLAISSKRMCIIRHIRKLIHAIWQDLTHIDVNTIIAQESSQGNLV
jgi:hypothetical protein